MSGKTTIWGQLRRTVTEWAASLDDLGFDDGGSGEMNATFGHTRGTRRIQHDPDVIGLQHGGVESGRTLFQHLFVNQIAGSLYLIEGFSAGGLIALDQGDPGPFPGGQQGDSPADSLPGAGH